VKEFIIKYFKGDRVIWAVIGFMFIFSLLAVYSSTGTLAYQYMSGNTTYYLFRHMMFLIVGVAVTYVTHWVHYKYFSSLAQPLVIISVPLLFLTLVIGVSRNEAARWLTLPIIGIPFQTSDLAKFALILFIARITSQYQDNPAKLKEMFKPIMIWIAVVCGLIFPANFSTAILLFMTCWLLLFVGRMNLMYLLKTAGALVLIGVFFLGLAFIAPNVGRLGTWKNRIVSFVKGEEAKDNLQVQQAKIAIVSGGMFGKGPGNSTQRNFLPHPYSDFIYAIIIEEYGSIGGLFILVLYLYLLYRAGVILQKSSRTFPALLAIGLTINLVFQALVNMAVAVNLLPVTGQPLPFVSMGGTSILFTCLSFGIILSISRTMELEKQVETAQTNI